MLSSFCSHPVLSPAWNLFSWAYSKPSPLLYYDIDKLKHILSSSEGGRQGDPLIPLAFALLVQALYASAAIEGVNLAADLDDSASKALRKAFTSFEKVIASAPRYHLPPNLQKTRLPLHPELEEACRVRGLQLEKEEVMEWLGGLVGKLDSEQARRWCIEQVEALRVPLFQRVLLHPQMPRHIALSLTRACLIPKLNFLSRFLPPSTTTPALSLFNSMVSHFFAQKLHAPPLDEGAKLQLSVPVSRLEASVSYPVNALPMLRIPPHLRYASLSPLFLANPDASLFHRLNSCLAFHFSNGVPHGEHLPEAVADCVDAFSDPSAHSFKLQHWLSQKLHSASVHSFLSNNEEKDSRYIQFSDARYKRSGGPHALIGP